MTAPQSASETDSGETSVNSDTATEPSVWHSSAVKVTLHQQLITKLLAYAGKIGILESKGAEVNKIIETYISRPEKPNYADALKAINALNPVKEQAKVAQAAFNLADWIQPGKEYDHKTLLKVYRAACAAFVGQQLRETLQTMHTSGFVTMPMIGEAEDAVDFLLAIIAQRSDSKKIIPGCLVLHEESQGDPLLDSLKASGASEVAVEDTPPFSGGSVVEWATDPDKFKGFILKARCGEQFALDLLGHDKAKWPSESEALNTILERQKRDPFPMKQGASELDQHIPRDENNQPVEDTVVSNAPKTLKDYFKEDKVRKNWWPNARGICANHGISDSKLQKAHIDDVLNVKKIPVEDFSVNDFVGTPEQATKLIEQSFASNGNGKPWAADPEKVAQVIERITPAALGQGFDVDPESVKAEACKALKIESLDKFEGSGANFITAVIALWKTNEEIAQEKKAAEEKEPLTLDETKADIRRRYNAPQTHTNKKTGKTTTTDYLAVQGRVLLFRLDHPDWTIEAEPLMLTEQTAIYKAIIRNAEGRIISTGSGRATEAGTGFIGGRYVEKAETAAIGRALALAGFGTDDTLDDADYLADSPVEKAS